MSEKRKVIRVSLCEGCNQWTAKDEDDGGCLHCIICQTVYVPGTAS